MKFHSYILILLHVLLFACATPGAPIGGPKDETPPKNLKTLPENFTTNFTSKKIAFYFNELVALKDMNSQLIVSPPLIHRPDIKDNGKVVNVIIKDTLLPNTTYNFDFGDAITDNNEGNILKNFSYTFSTGNHIDTLTICGKVLDALSLEPKKKVTVLLHDSLQSVFDKRNIRAIARTDDEGNFCLSNLNSEARYVIALEDANKDNKYDTIQDAIGFFPEKSAPKFLIAPVYPDSCSSEDSTMILDSITLLNDYHPITILTFKQKLVQAVVTSEFVHPYKIALGFRNEMKNKPSIECIQPSIPKDSLYLLWTSNTEVKISLPKDTVVAKNAVLIVNYGNRNDTLKIANTKANTALDKLKIEAKFGNTLPYFEKFTMTTSRPIREIAKDKIRYFVNDSTTVPLDFTVIDAENIILNYPFDSIKQHKILIPDSCFFDIYGFTNDTVKINFSIANKESFAKVLFNFESEYAFQNAVLQLLNDKFVVLDEYEFAALPDTFLLENIKAASYRFRIFIDSNHDGLWSPGNIITSEMPEQIFLLPKTMKLEKGWEYEEDWKLE
ncbi:hypothetical protein FACS1894180_2230 [Bacteroidia bacterium]|nr:hypothetical protein FACS1894180_2230 [Bacteroidia bacterium]